MNLAKKLLLALALTVGLAACDEGPMEKAGRKIDDAGAKAGDKLKDAAK